MWYIYYIMKLLVRQMPQLGLTCVCCKRYYKITIIIYYNPPGNFTPARFLFGPRGLTVCPLCWLPPPPPLEFIFSKFLNKWVSQCLADLSSFKHSANVSSLSWSGKHWHSASHALKSKQKATVKIHTYLCIYELGRRS